jgi:hypothetical protein
MAPPMLRLFQPERPMYGMTTASPGKRSSHSSAASREAAHLTPTPSASPLGSTERRKAKIFGPTLATTPSPHGSSCQAPGLARQ